MKYQAFITLTFSILFSWREHFLLAVSSRFGWDLVNNGSLDRQYRLEIITEQNGPIFNGEFGRIGAFEKQRP